MELKDLWSYIAAPTAGILIGIYHKIFVGPRLNHVEKETENQGKLLERIDERTEIMYNWMNKHFNHKK